MRSHCDRSTRGVMFIVTHFVKPTLNGNNVPDLVLYSLLFYPFPFPLSSHFAFSLRVCFFSHFRFQSLAISFALLPPLLFSLFRFFSVLYPLWCFLSFAYFIPTYCQFILCIFFFFYDFQTLIFHTTIENTKFFVINI